MGHPKEPKPHVPAVPPHPWCHRVTHILNVAREIDNFFPALFTYMNVRVDDEETAELLPHWNDTFLFLSRVRSVGHRWHWGHQGHTTGGTGRAGAGARGRQGVGGCEWRYLRRRCWKASRHWERGGHWEHWELWGIGSLGGLGARKIWGGVLGDMESAGDMGDLAQHPWGHGRHW